MSKEFDIDCLLKSIDYNLTDIARAEFHKWLRAKDKTIADLEAKLAELDSELAENVRENECLKEQLVEKKQELSDRETKWAKWNKKDRIEFAIEMLSELERILYESHYTCIEDKYYLEMEEFQGVVNQQIKQLNASNSMPLEEKGE